MSERTYVGVARESVGARGAQLTRFFGPLRERFRLGEGMLLVVNAAVVGSLGVDFTTGLSTLLVSVGVLAAAYSFNDFWDAEADRANPKKNQKLVGLLLEGRSGYARLLAAAHVGLVLAAWVLLGATTALAAAAMLGVNLGYSLRAKGMPGADVLVVVLWGALYTAIAAAPIGVCALVGALTLLMHVFQMHVDVEVDASNAVRTTAVVARSPVALVGAACVVVGGVLFWQLGPLWAATAVVPLVAQLGVKRSEAAWMCSRVYAGVVLLAALGALPSVG
jgi:4-hydroxybenzoate polyprenyltransferase